jgi:regulator of protease activity HflC (stomatin/prohibitin superfamily)
MAILYVVVVLAVVALIFAVMSVRIIKQYERVVVFELGKVKGAARGPAWC